MVQLALNRTQAGDLSAARESIRRAQSLEPASLGILAVSGFIRHFERAFDDAEKELARIVETAPQAAFARQFLAYTMLARGKGAEVLRLLDGRSEPGPTSLANLGRAHAQAGHHSEARRELARLDRLGQDGFGVGFAQALIHVDLGERDPALAALERGAADLSPMQLYLNVEPAFDGLRAHARFQALRQKLRLV
jgi:tetratricopeptide (TPR) repeat protein